MSTTAPTPHGSPPGTAEPFGVRVESDGDLAGIGILTLDQPGKPVVVLDLPLIQRLEATLTTLPSGLRGLVLASASPRAFVAGADLKTIGEWDDDQLNRYLEYGSRVFGMLGQLPFPTAAAINGAVLGGGLELAMHCDALVASAPAEKDGQPGKPYPVGLPEAGLSLCPGWGGTNLLPARMEPGRAIAMTATGTTMSFDQARGAGLFDAVSGGPGDLVACAGRWIAERSSSRVERDGRPPRWIGRPACLASVSEALDRIRGETTLSAESTAVFEAVEAGLTRGWTAALEVERHHLVRLRHLPAARSALAAFFAKSSGRS